MAGTPSVSAVAHADAQFTTREKAGSTQLAPARPIDRVRIAEDRVPRPSNARRVWPMTTRGEDADRTPVSAPSLST